ncbi:hypothetical protein EON65_50160 [archaeon]|nr:MAG: hypothetical protein EON65_50160 [archaeon]
MSASKLFSTGIVPSHSSINGQLQAQEEETNPKGNLDITHQSMWAAITPSHPSEGSYESCAKRAIIAAGRIPSHAS